jgi:serine kinase of HPr protein (carbohydrate metabolism regulator)
MSASSAHQGSVHASCVVLGAAGVLIRGASGAGKSRLAQILLARPPAPCRFARLVADDRVRLGTAGGRVIARPPPALAGLLELRGWGIVALPWEPAAVVRLVIDLDPAVPRLLDDHDRHTHLCEVMLPHMAAAAPEIAAEQLAVHISAASVTGSDAVSLAFALQH